jgi:mRNA interferase MazF
VRQPERAQSGMVLSYSYLWLEDHKKGRLAIVLSPHNYNAAVGLCVICPIASRVRDYPFEAKLPDGAGFRGVVLADQPRGISWEKRPIQHAGRAPDTVLTEVRERLAAVLGID